MRLRTPAFLASSACLLALGSPAAHAQNITAEFFAEPFGQLTDMAAATGVPNRLRVTTKQGLIKNVSVPGGGNQGIFLDIQSLVYSESESGLLGLAFHPDYVTNGKFYVSYTTGTGSGDSLIEQYTVSATDPDKADPTSGQIIWGPLPQISGGHKGGDIEFGPDGKLYFAIGDGYFDDHASAQDLLDPRGKVLRFDVDVPFPHIPADNPYVGNPAALDEIWAVGLRNPWRLGIDQLTGDVYVGDVGESGWEEVNYIPGGVGGLNFGWNCKEGMGCAGGCADCTNPIYLDPVWQFENGPVGCAMMGGTVYRGSAIPDLYGYYICDDFCTKKVWTFKVEAGVATDVTLQPNMTPTSGSWNNLAAWGTDAAGELYVLNHNGGTIFKIVSNSTCDSTNYCSTAPNSNGSGALIDFSGSTGVSADDFVMEATGAAVQQPGIFYYGENQVQVPFGDGFRCVGGQTYRLSPPLVTDASGDLSRPLDYSAPPSASGTITAGSTWNFQFWFRDPFGPGGTGWNLSDGMSVSFCP